MPVSLRIPGNIKQLLELVLELEVSGEKESRKTWTDIVKRGLELIGVDESVAFIEEDRESSSQVRPSLKRKI